MAYSQRLDLKQSQKLVLTQTMRQGLEMLQMSSLELSDLIAVQLLENPALEEDLRAEDEFSGPVESQIAENLSGTSDTMSREEINGAYDDGTDSGYSYTYQHDESKQNYIENAVSHHETLKDHLIWQARMTAESDSEYEIYLRVITSLDDHGFITQPLTELAESAGCSGKIFQEAVDRVRLFDPVGCAVPGIRESLLVQARHYFPDEPDAALILEKCFPELESLNYEKISAVTGLEVRRIIEMSRIIQKLDPFPARNFSSRSESYIVPDAEVLLVEGEPMVFLNDGWIPGIRLNSYCIDLLKNRKTEGETLLYLQEKVQEARSLLRNITGRRETLLKVVRAIVERQTEFFRSGPGNLRPLTHFEIAEITGFHESTVSRAVAGKYLQSHWGTFELKYFFVSRIRAVDDEPGEEASSDRVKYMIEELVKGESRSKPLSDEDIRIKLEEGGVNVARRTVAKYRGILNISSAAMRKKIYMIKSEESGL